MRPSVLSSEHTRQRPALRVTLVAVFSLFLAQQWMGTAAAVAAGITPAAGAPASQHPLIDTSRNGVPIVDIAPPSAAGVSNNLYSQFNVDHKGLILNNSPGNVRTQLGGWIAGNPLLGPTNARVIINQVTSGNPSQLLGAMEVAGQRADLVVANPSGIACNGCAFINTGHATLTTGIPQFDAAGRLSGFNVQQGVIAVGAAGLDASQAERLDLDARSLSIDGGIWAQQLGVVAGANSVPYGSTQAMAAAPSGTAPAFAVDVSALGGMYANQIILVATEAGLGVNSLGRLAALQGNLQLSANGNLTIDNASATGNLALSGANATFMGATVSTGGAVQIHSSGQLNNSGQIDAASGLNIQAANMTNSGALVQRDAAQTLSISTSGALANAGSIASAGDLAAQAGAITDTQGAWNAQRDLTLQAGSQSLSGTTLDAGGATTLAATAGDLAATGTTIASTGNLAAAATGAVSNAGGTWQSGGNTTLQGASLTNSGTVQATGTLSTTGATLSNDGGTLASGATTTVTALQGASNQNGTVSGASGLDVTTGGAALNNAGGSLVSGAAATVTSGALNNTSGTLAAGGNLAVTSTALNNTAGRVQSTANLTLNTQGQTFNNAGGTLGGQTVQITAGNLDNTGGTLAATQGLALTAQALTNANSGATAGIQAGGPLNVAAASLANDTGFIGSNAALDLTLGGLLTNGSGTLQSGAVLNATASQITGGGRLLATGPLALQAQSIHLDGASLQSGAAATLAATAGDVQTSSTQIASTGPLSATATGAVANAGGIWQSGGNTTLQGVSLTNSGTVQAGGALTAVAASALNNDQGKLLAAGLVSVKGAVVSNDGGTLASGGKTTVTAQQGASNQNGTVSGATGLSVTTGSAALNNAGGTLVSGAATTITSGALNNSAGLLAAGGNLAVTSAAFDNTAGRVQSTANVTVSTQGQTLDNTRGKIEAAGSANLNSGALVNTGGTLSAHAVSLNAGTLTNDGGNLVSGTTLDAATGAVSNSTGLIAAATGLQLNTQGAALSNTASGASGGIVSGGTLTVQSGTLTNQGGVLASNADQSLAVQGDLNNVGGSITTLGNLNATASGALGNASGTLAAGQAATLTAGELDNSAGGNISAQTLTVNANTLGNASGFVQAGQDATLTTASLDNTAGTVSAQRNLTVKATALTNTVGTLVGNTSANITTGSASFGGTINSAGAVNLTVNGAYTNTGTVSTQGNLQVRAQSLTNAAGATLASGGTLSATTSGDLTNAGTLNAAGGTTLNAGGTLANSGLIDSGATTSLTAPALANTGRIYGNAVSITAGNVNNTAGATGGAVIASRGDMAIAANSLSNTGNSMILALGNLAIAGSFDPITGVATSASGSLLNASSTIQSGADMGLMASSITNRNDHLVLGTTTTSQALGTVQVQALSGGLQAISTVIDASQLVWVQSQWSGNPTWVLPSATYPFNVFGAQPIPREIVTSYQGGDSGTTTTTTTTHTYAPTDPVWQKFGVTPPPQPPVPGAGATLYSTYDARGNPVQACTPSTSSACQTYQQQLNAYNSTATQNQITQAETGLDNAIAAFNTDVLNRQMYAYTQYNLTGQTTTTTTVQSTDPAKILSGGNLTVAGGSAGSLLNANSTLVAAGNLNIAAGVLNNQSTTGTQETAQTGNYAVYKMQYHGGFRDDYSKDYKGGGAYNPPPTTTQIDLPTVTVVSGGNPGMGSVQAPTVVAQSSVLAGAVRAPLAIATHPPGQVAGIAAQALGAPGSAPPALQSSTLPSTNGKPALVISTSPPALGLPNNQLFQIATAPSSPYLVETDPAFTNQNNFLSSNSYLQQLGIDPAQWQLRYGDGFAEQQLVQNQILALTGRNTLSGYSNTQDEYAALMRSGVAFAQRYGIAPGVSLSPEQMALVTTDMVMLTTRTVTLPDGGTRQVLVPQVYLAHPQAQDLTQGGALIAGGTVHITTAQDLVNGGTLSGNSVQVSAGHDLVNSGTIAAQHVLLSAGNDLGNLSGLIAGTTGTGTVSLQAGRDLMLQTQTTAATSATGSSTSLNRIATVQGGTVTLQAARDLLAQGAQIAAAGDLSAVAGRNLTLGAATTTTQFDTGAAPGGNRLQATTSTQHGSTATAGGNATLVAQGGDLTVTASRVAAGGNATLAGQNVSIASGVNTTTRSSHLVNGSGYGDSTATTQRAAVASVQADHNLTVQAAGNGQAGSGDLTVTGARLSAQNGQTTLQAAHDLSVVTLALNASTTSHGQGRSSGLFGSSTTTSTASSSSTTQAASTVRGTSVAMVAGNNLNLTGSNVAGTGTPPGAGQVSLSAGNALNVTAAALTEHSQSSSQTSGGTFGRSGKRTAQLDQTTAQASSLTGSTVALQSGGDTTLQAAQLSGNAIGVQAGVINGQTVNPAAQIHIDAAINDHSSSRSSTGHDLFTQSSAGQGDLTQTLQYTTLSPPGADQPGTVQLQAPGGITVGASSLPPAGAGNSAGRASNSSTAGTPPAVPTLTLDLKQQAQQLATQPGLGYMAQLAQRNDVAWQQVQLAAQHWDYSQSGLTGAAAAIIAVAVAVVTYGAAAAWSASMMAGAGMTTTAGAAGASTVAVAGAGAGMAGSAVAGGTVLTTTGAALSGAAAAGFSSLASEAAVSLAGNGGNLGQTLHDLGSSQSVHNILASMLTAGAGQTLSGYNLGNLAGKAVTGCAAGSISGTGCQNGAESAAVTNAAAWTYNSVIGYDANAGPGKTPAPSKDYPFYKPQANGQQPVDSFGNNVIGLNISGSVFSQGSTLSNSLNRVPFINATAGVHDWFFNASPTLNSIFPLANIPLMGVASLAAMPAALGDANISYLPLQTIEIKNKNEEKK